MIAAALALRSVIGVPIVIWRARSRHTISDGPIKPDTDCWERSDLESASAKSSQKRSAYSFASIGYRLTKNVDAL